MRFAESLRFLVVFVIGFIGLALAVSAGLLMLISPKLHAEFWRWWYTRIGRTDVSIFETGSQTQLRMAGLIITIVGLFFLWILCGRLLNH